MGKKYCEKRDNYELELGNIFIPQKNSPSSHLVLQLPINCTFAHSPRNPSDIGDGGGGCGGEGKSDNGLEDEDGPK